MAKLYETINAGNWIKGRMTDEHGACLFGHLLRLDSFLVGKYVPIADAIELLYPERVCYDGKPGGIVGFNDHPDTTVEDVIRVCKVADV